MLDFIVRFKVSRLIIHCFIAGKIPQFQNSEYYCHLQYAVSDTYRVHTYLVRDFQVTAYLNIELMALVQ